ncbi:MAG TPA: 2-phosphosulfolactate phosphatase [Gemmatales bacterium]|nr:2-phosphosulfolactate phosphatase [Gemmatales bacterium]
MAESLQVHLLPGLVEPAVFQGSVVVVIDVLRATGEAVILGGEREAIRIPGFDLGNSPQEYSWDKCQGKTLIFTTTNGTRALLQAQPADKLITAGFVNFSAVCEVLLEEKRPVHFLCAGTQGHISLEDTLLAGAFLAALVPHRKDVMNDSARLAWDTFEGHGLVISEALKLSAGGRQLAQEGLGEDIEWAAQVDRLMLVPEVRYDGIKRMYLQIGSVGLERRLWPGK